MTTKFYIKWKYSATDSLIAIFTKKKLKEHGPSSIYKYVLIVLTISNVRGPSIILEIQTK